MPSCGTRYLLTVELASGRRRQVSAQYVEDRLPDANGRPGRLVERRIVRVLLDGYPVLRSFNSLQEALGEPFKVLTHAREMGPTWHSR